MKCLLVLLAFTLFGCHNGQQTEQQTEKQIEKQIEQETVYDLPINSSTEPIVVTEVTEPSAAPTLLVTENTSTGCSACAEVVEELAPKLSNVRQNPSRLV